MNRDDLSSKLIHLTRGEPDQVAADAFLSIMRERKLRSGTTYIRGSHPCVCFSEAPLSKLSHLLANPGTTGMRYKPFGVMVDKTWLFDRGGRPVIYQPDDEYKLLDESQRYRHVRYEPGSVDFTWEREWRVHAKELALDPAAVTLIVPTRAWEQWVFDQFIDRLSLQAQVLPESIGLTKFEWHFLVLEDLGVEFPGEVTPPR